MKFALPTKILTAILALFASCFSMRCQEKSALLKTFDASVGIVNLGINNGTLHTNPYRTINYTHPYYSDQYAKGSAFYDGENYSDLLLKYDIYQDVLIKKIDGESNLGINLIREKTAYFFIDSKKFINLNYNRTGLPEFVKGYYEENAQSDALKLYIKHYKTRYEVLRDQSVMSNFEVGNDFVLSYKNVFYKIKSKKDLAAIFPEIKDKINDYYQGYRNENEVDFMNGLVAYINKFLITTPN